MSDTLRQQIIAAVVARMQTIRVAAGYLTDVGARVGDWETSWEQKDLPALSVCDLVEENEKKNREAVQVTRKLPVVIRIFTSGREPADELRKMIADVEKAIGADVYWGALARGGTWPKRSGMLVPDDSFEIAGAAVEVVIEYYTKPFNAFG